MACMLISPQSHARIGGLLYLLIIAAGLFAEFVREQFVMPGNAAATASNITDDAFMFRLGIAADLSTFVCAVALTIILYVLLKPFNGKALGALMAIAGVSYLTLSTAQLLSPRLASVLFPSILVPALIGELSFAVWLTVKGVNVARWKEKAGLSTASL
jgi:Domain of unknown function (DUF4386)